jgi:hypothetical protein
MLSREQNLAFEISIAPLVPSFVSSYCPRCLRKSVSPSPVLYTTDSLKGAPVLYAFRCLNKCVNSTCIYHSRRLCGTLCWSCDKFDLRVIFTLPVDTFCNLGAPVSSLGTLEHRPGRPNSIDYGVPAYLYVYFLIL